MRLLSVLLAGLVLTGCSMSKPIMDEALYTEVAKAHVGIEYFARMGWMSSDVVTFGKRAIATKINQYSYDEERLNGKAKLINSFETKPNQDDCNKVAMEVQGYNQRNTLQNQTGRDNQRETQELINSTRMQNTYCNRIGTQMFCNTY